MSAAGSDNESDHLSAVTLRAFRDGHLNHERAQQVEIHLARCAACRALLARDPPVDSGFGLAETAMLSTSDPSHPSHASDPSPASSASASPVAASSSARATGKMPDLVAVRGYEILAELGRGGMGVVYRARHQTLKREVALKVLLSGTHSSPQDRERFLREAETTARLRHSGIVQIFEIGEHDGHPFLALELVEGGSLLDLVQGRPQPVRWAAAMLLQLANAVQFAHQQSVVHRDLKPGNILLCHANASDIGSGEVREPLPSGSGEVPLVVPTAKITDFGLARQLDSDSHLTRTGTAMGTPAYMAPEQASGKSGPSTDIYALGAILYELLTGRPPFTEPDVYRTLQRVLNDDPESPRVHRPDLPRDLETICLKCLMKEPAQRYATARDLAVDIELFLRGEPILAKPLNLGGRLLRWARHRPMLAATWLVCAVFYGLHLIAMNVFRLPQHTPFFHALLTGLFATWAFLAWLMQRMIDRQRDSVLGQYTFMGMAILSMTLALTYDAGPRSAPAPGFFLAIVCGTLLVPRPRMIALTTGLSVACYVWLLLHAAWLRPAHLVPPDVAIGFLFSLIVLGIVLHMLLRRVVGGRMP